MGVLWLLSNKRLLPPQPPEEAPSRAWSCRASHSDHGCRTKTWDKLPAEGPIFCLEGAGRTEQRGVSVSTCVSHPSPHSALQTPKSPRKNLATRFQRKQYS